MTKIYHAQCPCSALRIAVHGEPVHNHVCTCTRCRRASGSALSHNVWFPEAAVQVIAGHYTIWCPEGEEAPGVMKAFCSRCGGGGFSRSGDYLPGTLVFQAGTFADRDFPAPDHVHWWGSRPQWLELAEEIERLPGN
jgi:hypothetical protein